MICEIRSSHCFRFCFINFDLFLRLIHSFAFNIMYLQHTFSDKIRFCFPNNFRFSGKVLCSTVNIHSSIWLPWLGLILIHCVYNQTHCLGKGSYVLVEGIIMKFYKYFPTMRRTTLWVGCCHGSKQSATSKNHLGVTMVYFKRITNSTGC